jgi:Ribbon-helix-helix protein, copG family
LGIDESKAQAHEGRRTGAVVSVRLKPAEAELLEALAERDGRSLSETLRLGLHCLASKASGERAIALHGELGPRTRGEWDERRVAQPA